MNMVHIISTTELVVFKVLNVLSLFNQKQYMPGKQDLRLLHVNVFSLLLMCFPSIHIYLNFIGHFIMKKLYSEYISSFSESLGNFNSRFHS